MAGHLAAADLHVYCDPSNPNPGDGTEGNPWRNLSSIPWSNLEAAAAGGTDVFINLKRGGEWREKLLVGGSGSSNHPITIRPYGSGPLPVLHGGETITNWTPYSAIEGSVWRWESPLAASTLALFRDNDVLAKTNSVGSLRNHQWCVSGGAVFLRDDDGDPFATGVTVYAVARDRAIDCRSRHDLRFEDLVISGGSSAAIYLQQSANVAVTRCRVVKSVQAALLQGGTNITFRATTFGQSVNRGIYITGSNVSATFLFCLMTPGPSGGPSVYLDGSGSKVDLINCTMAGSRSRHVSNAGANTVRLLNCVLSVPAVTDRSILGESIRSTAGTVTAEHCLIQPNGQWLEHFVDGALLGPGCIFVSPGFVRNASRGFLSIGLDDTPSFYAFTNLARIADSKGLKVYLSANAVESWMQPALQKLIVGGHDILCHTFSHCLLSETNALTMQYAGSGSSAAVTVNSNTMTLTVEGTNVSTIALEGPSSAYNITRLAAAVNSAPGFTANLLTHLEANVPSKYLETVSNLSLLSPQTLRWNMGLKWTNELGGWSESIRNAFTNASGAPYETPYVAYPSGAYDETTIQELQRFGFKGGRTTLYAGRRLKDFDIFQFNAAPVFMGRGAQLKFENNANDDGGLYNFTPQNVSFSTAAIEGLRCGVFNGSNSLARTASHSIWDFSLGDWHVAAAVQLAEQSGEQTVFHQGTGTTDSLQIGISGDGSAFVAVRENGNESLRLSTAAGLVTPDGHWHKIKATQSGDRWRVHVDGVVRAETNSSVRCKSYTNDVVIGCFGNGTTVPYVSFLNGKLDDFSQGKRTYMNTHAVMDTAAEAGFIYVPYSHSDNTSLELFEGVLEAAAEYPGGSAAMLTPTAAFEQILASSKVVSNRWLTLTNLAPPDYRLGPKSKARAAANSAALQGWPDVEDLNGTRLTDSNGSLLPAAMPLDMGAYQSLSRPTLQLRNAGQTLHVLWPADAAEWHVYSTTSLVTTAWEQVSNLPTMEGTNWVLQVPQDDRQRFYQLRSQ